MKKLCSFVLLAIHILIVNAQSDIIHNDTFWHCTDGTPIYSQGGGIFRFTEPSTGKERYYWYGVHYKEAELYAAHP